VLKRFYVFISLRVVINRVFTHVLGMAIDAVYQAFYARSSW